MNRRERAGIGMTSARTRDRLVDRLRRDGIRNEEVLARIREVPRHLFVVERRIDTGPATDCHPFLVEENLAAGVARCMPM